MSIESVKAELKERWADQPALELCVRIVDYIGRVGAQQSSMLTYRSFAKILNRDNVDSDIIQAIAILSSSNIAALDPHALFVDEDDNEHEIPAEELSEAIQDGNVIHPVTGVKLLDAHDRIIPFFEPSEKLASSLK